MTDFISVDPTDAPWDADAEDEQLRRYLLDNPDGLGILERVEWAQRCGLDDVEALLMPILRAEVLAGADIHSRHPGHFSQKVHGNRKGGRQYYENGAGTDADPYRTNDVHAAAVALAEGKSVRLDSPDEVSTFLGELKTEVDRRKAAGDTRPVNLCKVSVPDTNLFCVESKGIPRVKMPQLKQPVDRVRPGSPVDKMLKSGELVPNAKGEVDIGPLFVAKLKDDGIGVTAKRVDASHLKASQNELDALKVTGIAAAQRKGVVVEESIFTTSDNYVVDGHHRWAAYVVNEYVEGHALYLPVNEIDIDIITALQMSNDFAVAMGIPGAGMEVGRATGLKCQIDGICR